MVPGTIEPPLVDGDPPCRRFNLGDMMILIAALAPGLARVPSEFMLIGFAVSKLLPPDQWSREWLREAVTGRSWAATTLAGEALNLLVPFLLILPLAQLLFRLRHPRPPINRALLQPGTAASGALVLTFLVLFELSALGFLPPWPLVRQVVGGGSVALAWVVLAISGRWRREPGWIDRMGQIVGAAWVMTAALIVAAWTMGQ
jgi:hypothetical protein